MHNPSNNNCPRNADPRNETCSCDADRAQDLREWLGHLHDAQRFGSQEPGKVADVLTYGGIQEDPPASHDVDETGRSKRNGVRP